MRPHEIESWAIRAVDAVLAWHAGEDSRVEFKRESPSDAAKAARPIAAHINASRGAPVLWIVGVDEEARVVNPTKMEDLADWWVRVRNPIQQYVQLREGAGPFLTDLRCRALLPIQRRPAWFRHLNW